MASTAVELLRRRMMMQEQDDTYANVIWNTGQDPGGSTYSSNDWCLVEVDVTANRNHTFQLGLGTSSSSQISLQLKADYSVAGAYRNKTSVTISVLTCFLRVMLWQSAIDDCYILDTTDNVYLFKGKNV